MLLYTTRHIVREVSCPSLLLVAFVAFSLVPQDQFMLTGMKLNLFSSLDLLITSKLNPSDQPSSWAVPEAENSFSRHGQMLRSHCVLSLPAAADSQLIFLLHFISPLCCLALGLFYLLFIVQGGILCFSCNLPRFLIMLHGQRSKIQFKLSLVRKLKGICWQKERKMIQCCGLHGFLKWRLAYIFDISNPFPSTWFHKECSYCQEYSQFTWEEQNKWPLQSNIFSNPRKKIHIFPSPAKSKYFNLKGKTGGEF